MFLKVHSKDSNKEAYLNFDNVLSIVQEDGKTILMVIHGSNSQRRYEIAETAKELVAELNKM